MTILITSFEPFAGRKTNLSQLTTQRLLSRNTSKAWKMENVVFACLPVTFNNVEKTLKKLIKKHSVTKILLTGENRKSKTIQLERIALNVAHADIADNSGNKYRLAELSQSNNLALMTKIDIEAISNKIKKAGLPNRISHHSGTFVCNAAYYHALTICKDSLFIHLPPRLPGGRKKYKKSHIDCLADGIEIALKYLNTN